jgi:hypothetical protein
MTESNRLYWMPLILWASLVPSYPEKMLLLRRKKISWLHGHSSFAVAVCTFVATFFPSVANAAMSAASLSFPLVKATDEWALWFAILSCASIGIKAEKTQVCTHMLKMTDEWALVSCTSIG